MPFTRVSLVAYGALALCVCAGPSLVACGGGQTFDDGGDPLSSTDEEPAVVTDTAEPPGGDSTASPPTPEPGAGATPAGPGTTPAQTTDTTTDDDSPMDTSDTDDTATDSESERDSGAGDSDDLPDAGVHTDDAGCETCEIPADAASVDTTDASDINGGCENATVGDACAPEGLSCSDHCTDRCMFCYIMVCSEGTWASFEVFPEPCFDCGDALCSSIVEYCLVRTPAIPEEPAVYECRLSPEDCVDDGCSCQPGATSMSACEGP